VPGGIRAAEHAQQQRGQHALEEDIRRVDALQEAADALHIAGQLREHHTQDRAERAPDEAQHDCLAQDQTDDAAAAPAEGAQDADLARALQHGHHHRVHHAEPAHQDGDGGNAPRERLDHAGPLLGGVILARNRGAQILIRSLDAADHLVHVDPALYAHLEQAHLPRLLADFLRIAQGYQPAGFLHGLAGLVDADDMIRHAVEAHRVVDVLLERLGRAAADRDLLRPRDGLAFDDAIVARSLAARLVTKDEEERHVLSGDPGIDPRLNGGNAGDGLDASRVLFVQARE